ncbi:serine protease [Alicyclobacillus acidoterrestris]|uniref:S1C family serine protease n=1 Tax=Alicyclobacillus suci TaxID=2816080 RepID=UPI00119167AA|nr:trypsin-like peptidase domain-containing protein [Alicyclobacillus suci]GEO27285.1 serine protease [Alicyclobacillus acidoterrestris]
MGFLHGRTRKRTQRTRNRSRFTCNIKRVQVAVLTAMIGTTATYGAQTALPCGLGGAVSSNVAWAGVQSTVGQSASGTMHVQTVGFNVDDGVTSAVKRVEPDVVGILNYAQVSNYFSQQSKLQATGVGTGVMFYKDNKFAYLVTNNHVVEGGAKVEIVLNAGKHVNATVVGTDPYTDLAVLKVPAATFKRINPVNFANSDTVEPGESAIAIGTPMGLDFADTVTKGIVSAKSRIMPVQDEASQQTLDYQSVIQTDAAINPGNSGGPLVNINGEVIGINSSKIVAQNFEGMGFAIPSNSVRNIAKQLMQTGHAQHSALGIEAYSLSSLPQQMWPDVPVDYGVWVKLVTSSSVKKDGLKAGDVIVGLNGKTVKTIADLRTYLFQLRPGDKAILKVYRGGQALIVKTKVGAMETQLTTASAPTTSSGADDSDSAEPMMPFSGGIQ